MNPEYRMQRLRELIDEYRNFKSTGRLDLTSEETIRTWLNGFLEIFHWDVRDTSQILQEKVLSTEEKERLSEIESQNIRPDYTFKIAKQKLTFLDAKGISINIENDADAAFQIKSYGWSISAPCAFLSNFEEFAIYDCTYVPERSQNPNLGRIYLTIDNYLENFEILDDRLLRENVYGGKLNTLYSDTLRGNSSIKKLTPDFAFAKQLSSFRIELANNILSNNRDYIANNAENLSYIVQIIINRILFIRVCEARKIEEERLLKNYCGSGFWDTFKNSSYFDFYEHYDGLLFDRVNSIHDLIISDNVFERFIDNLYYPSPYKFDVIPTKLLSDIYDIFLSTKLEIENNEVLDKYKSEYIKTKGAVSTPQYIIQDIVKKTIRKQEIIENGINRLFEKKILDVASGSGAFLIEAYEYLEGLFKELYLASNEREFDQYFIARDNEIIINLKGKRALLENCIFGVDIDPEAVEVSKMSLSLKIVDSIEYLEVYNEIGIFGSKILNGVGKNIKCGNTLVSTDILDLYPNLANNQEELIKTNIFDWWSEEGFSHIFNKYLFSWDNIPGEDNRKLIEFLEQNFGIDWLRIARIKKIDNNTAIRIFTNEKSLSLRLNDEKIKLNLIIDDVRAHEFIVKIENDRYDIYYQGKGFDYVISNPPYVEVKNYNVDLPYMHQYIKEKYPSSKNGKIDLAIPFIERAIQLLNTNGRLGFIVQKRFFKTEYGKKIREIIAENRLISSVTDFETTSIFKGRITYVSIITLDKTQPNSFFYKKICNKIDTLPFELRNLEIPELNPSEYIQLPSSVLSAAPWDFTDPDLLKIRNDLLEFGRFGDFVNVKVGIQVLWDKAYHITPIRIQNSILVGKTSLEEEFEIELAACRPLICNERFYCFRKDDADVYVIFPYNVENDNVSEIQFTEFASRFPLAAQYLLRNKSTIQDNVITFPDEERWHLFTRVQNHGATYPKVLTPMTANDTFATISFSDKVYCDNANVYFVEIEDKSETNLYALAGIINSTLFCVLAKSYANPQTGGYFKFNKQFLEPIPFPIENFRNNLHNLVNELAECSQNIKQDQERYLTASPRQKRTIKLLLKRNWIRLDELVYDLYELNATTNAFFKSRERTKDRISILNGNS